jgi:hypothetical protein
LFSERMANNQVTNIEEIIAQASEGLEFRHRTIHKNDTGSLVLRVHRGFLVLEVWIDGPQTQFTLAGWDGDHWSISATDKQAEAWMVEVRELLGEPQPELSINRKRQLQQVKRLNRPAYNRANKLVQSGKVDEAANIICKAIRKANDSFFPKPHRSDACERCGSWRRCGCQEMERVASLPDNVRDATVTDVLNYEPSPIIRQPVSPGDDIQDILGQSNESEVYQPTPEEKQRGLDAALKSRQPKPGVGGKPVEWQF